MQTDVGLRKILRKVGLSICDMQLLCRILRSFCASQHGCFCKVQHYYSRRRPRHKKIVHTYQNLLARWRYILRRDKLDCAKLQIAATLTPPCGRSVHRSTVIYIAHSTTVFGQRKTVKSSCIGFVVYSLGGAEYCARDKIGRSLNPHFSKL